MSRDINLLVPQLKERLLTWMSRCLKAGLHPLITCTGRTMEEQTALYAQGRETPSVVNELRRAAGLEPISDEEASRIVTWTLHSQHIIQPDGYCRAFDFCLTTCAGGPAYWDTIIDIDHDNIPDYAEAGRIASDLGLNWGGNWVSHKDFPHIQLLG